MVGSDYLKALANSLARWFPRPPVALGTDGFGRSESRGVLRRFFEVDAAAMVWAVLVELVGQGRVDEKVLVRAQGELGVDQEKVDPVYL